MPGTGGADGDFSITRTRLLPVRIRSAAMAWSDRNRSASPARLGLPSGAPELPTGPPNRLAFHLRRRSPMCGLREKLAGGRAKSSTMKGCTSPLWRETAPAAPLGRFKFLPSWPIAKAARTCRPLGRSSRDQSLAIRPNHRIKKKKKWLSWGEIAVLEFAAVVTFQSNWRPGDCRRLCDRPSSRPCARPGQSPPTDPAIVIMRGTRSAGGEEPCGHGPGAAGWAVAPCWTPSNGP